MAADRRISSIQMEIDATTTMIAASSTPNTGATGLTVPAPSAASQPPASCRNFSALAEPLEPIAVASQSVESIRIWAQAGAAKENTPAIGRYTKAERIAWLRSDLTIAWATESSSIGKAKMIAIASMMRYWATNQPALVTFGEVVPLISLPTFSRNHWPAWAVPAWHTLRSTGLETLSQLRCLAVVSPGGCGPGACWAAAAGADNRSRARTPTSASSQRPRARLRSRSIVVLLELPCLLEELRERRGHLVGRDHRDGRGPAAHGDLLPVRGNPFQVDHGHAPSLRHRDAGDRAGQAGGQDGDASALVVVALDVLADRHGHHHRLLGARRAGRHAQALAGQPGGLVRGVQQRGLGPRRGQRGDRLVPAGVVEQQRAAEHTGVLGGGGGRARARVRPADPDAGVRPGGAHAGAGGTRRGGVPDDRRALRGAGRLGRSGRLRRAARARGAPADHQPAREQHQRKQQQAEPGRRHPRPGGAAGALVGQAVDDPGPAALGHRHGWLLLSVTSSVPGVGGLSGSGVSLPVCEMVRHHAGPPQARVLVRPTDPG